MLLIEINEKWGKQPVASSNLDVYVIIVGGKILQGVQEVFRNSRRKQNQYIFMFSERKRKLVVQKVTLTLLCSSIVMQYETSYVLFL